MLRLLCFLLVCSPVISDKLDILPIILDPTEDITTSNGVIRGAIDPSGLYKEYYGIPYAYTDQAHRFQAPMPVPPWSGVMYAYNDNILCPQKLYESNITAGVENCLTLNIYTPVNSTGPLPVMVFFYGGGFTEGTNSPFNYGPDYLVPHDVILVTVNYRIGSLGFLCLGIKEAPGNAGMKDQVAALRWIQRNIGAFGGDRDSVTIVGESAGSASVVYLILSPMARGLFSKAIMESGSAISPWSLQYTPIKTASLYAEQLGNYTMDPYELYNNFMSKSLEEITQITVPRSYGDIYTSELMLSPCVEKSFEGVEPFLLDSPYNILKSGRYEKVPVIMGFDSQEGYRFVGKENATTIANINFFDSIPRDLAFPTFADKKRTAYELNQTYLHGQQLTYNNLIEFSSYEGETAITFPVIATIDLFLQTSDQPVFAYNFTYSGNLNLIKLLYGYQNLTGATHADEVFYIFTYGGAVKRALEELVMIDKMTTLWTNFAKYGDPTPVTNLLLPVRWQPADPYSNRPKALVIGRTFSYQSIWAKHTIRFLNHIYQKYRRIYIEEK